MGSEALHVGDFAPAYTGITNAGKLYSLEMQAGRPVVMLLFDGMDTPSTTAFLHAFERRKDDFRAFSADVVGITADEPEVALDYTFRHPTGVTVSCGASPFTVAFAEELPAVLVLDANRVVIGYFPRTQPEAGAVAALLCLAKLPREPAHDVLLQAPVLILPKVFTPEFCRTLIEQFNKGGHFDSGFMSIDENGKAMLKVDHAFKRRKDHFVAVEHPIHEVLMDKIASRVAVEIKKAFHADVTHCERFLIACYDDAGGYFRRHRDDTGPGNTHRQFALTINLNTEEYDGGHLIFPEYGPHRYRPGTGDAVVFSGSLLHEAAPVTRGKRYALLGFIHDDEAHAQYEARHG